MKFGKLIPWILLLLLLAACASATSTPTPTPTVDPTAPIVSNFDSAGSFKGGAGTYTIKCHSESSLTAGPVSPCSATVTTETICTDKAAKSVLPTITITHGTNIVEKRAFADDGAGNWVIKRNSIEYIPLGDSVLTSCTSEVSFIVILPYGGSVTKYP